MAISNRNLLIQGRKKEKRGLPAFTNEVSTSPIKKRGTGAVGAGFTGKTGTQGKAKRETAAGLSLLKTNPEVAEDIIEPGDALAREFKDVRPQEKSTAAKTGASTGLPGSNFRIAETTAPGTATARARDRKAKGLDPIGGGDQAPVAKFGLPTDRLPSFNELGGAIGSLFKYVGELSKFNRARGLVPGVKVQDKNKGKGLGQKDMADILTKQLEIAQLAGDKDKSLAIETELDKIIHPDRESDVAAIINE